MASLGLFPQNSTIPHSAGAFQNLGPASLHDSVALASSMPLNYADVAPSLNSSDKAEQTQVYLFFAEAEDAV